MITLYTKPNCPYCEQAKSWFNKNDIAYVTIDISQDASIVTMLREAGHRTVPQIYLDGELFVEGGYTGLSKQDPQILKEQIQQRKVAA